VHARYYDRTAIAAALKAWRLVLRTKGRRAQRSGEPARIARA